MELNYCLKNLTDMNYRETYNDLDKRVNADIIELAKEYDAENPKNIKVTIYGVGILDDYDLVKMWYDEDANNVCFLNSEDEEQMFYFFDLDTRIDILNELNK